MASYQKIKAPAGTPAMPPRLLIKLMLMMNAALPMPEPAFVKPDNWGTLTPEERRNLRMENWVNGENIKFANPEAKKAYKERASLLRDAVDMNKKPARVPVNTLVGVYPQRRVGLTPKAMFYDQHADAALAHIQYHLDLEPDFTMFNLMFSGPALDLLDFQVLEWPGAGLPAEQSYQFNEVEFLKGDEYAQLLSDPSDFMLRTAMPRMFKSLEGLKSLPQFSSGYMGFADLYLPFAFPEVKKALKILQKAAELTVETLPATEAMLNGAVVQGHPAFYGTLAIAPFDALGDVLRSTRGVLMDMYRRPDDVIAACDMYVKILLDNPAMNFSGSPLVFIPLHKGADRFMSQEQFETFYWPSLKKVMLGLVEDGFIPTPFAEGSYNKRLETIADFPKGCCMWHFDQTDMKRASEILSDTCAIMGNVPASLTTTGTPEQMTAYCKDLIETCGPSGNFILTNGCQVDEAKDENLKAMIDSVKQFVV
jgi:hypothetical protein